MYRIFLVEKALAVVGVLWRQTGQFRCQCFSERQCKNIMQACQT